MRTFLGIRLRTSEMMTLDKKSTKITAMPIPKPLLADLVTASNGHSPRTSLNGGISLHRPLLNSFHMLAIVFSYDVARVPRGTHVASGFRLVEACDDLALQ